MNQILTKIYEHSPNFLRTIALNSYAFTLNWERYGKKFYELYGEFEKHENFSYAELEEYQRERFSALIKHCYENVPYYHDIMSELRLKPNDFQCLEDLQKLPLLTRDLVKKNEKKLQARNIKKWETRHGHTSGTTGSPLNFLWDTTVCVAHHVVDWRQKKKAGFFLGDPFVSIQGRTIVPPARQKPPFWVMNYVHNQLFMSSFHLKDEFIGYYLDKLESFHPKGVEGYPSVLYIIARYMQSKGRTCPVPAVLTSSETLLPFQRELIEDRFQCKVFDFYGMAERVVFGSECSEHTGRHLNMDYGITEIVKADGEVASKGEFGSIVGTSLWNFAMPFIRYKTSDVSSITQKTCPCGSSFPVLDPVTTKDEDIVVLPDGRLLSSSVLTHPFKPITTIKKSQIIQETINHIKVLLVMDEGFCDSDSEILLKGLRERMGPDVLINIEVVDSLPSTSAGKFRWVISKIPLSKNRN